jgi:hypothetical protein
MCFTSEFPYLAMRSESQKRSRDREFNPSVIRPAKTEAIPLRAKNQFRHRQAAAAGYRSPAVYRHEPVLGPLRGRDEFQLLLLDLSMPANPFATAR